MTDERWDYFPFMRVYATILLLLYKNFPLFSWSLNSRLNSLGLYFALLHSRLTGKSEFQLCKLLLTLALKMAQGTWSSWTVTLGWGWLVHFSQCLPYNHHHVGKPCHMQVWAVLLFSMYNPSRSLWCLGTYKESSRVRCVIFPFIDSISHNLLSSNWILHLLRHKNMYVHFRVLNISNENKSPI